MNHRSSLPALLLSLFSSSLQHRLPVLFFFCEYVFPVFATYCPLQNPPENAACKNLIKSTTFINQTVCLHKKSPGVRSRLPSATFNPPSSWTARVSCSTLWAVIVEALQHRTTGENPRMYSCIHTQFIVCMPMIAMRWIETFWQPEGQTFLYSGSSSRKHILSAIASAITFGPHSCRIIWHHPSKPISLSCHPLACNWYLARFRHKIFKLSASLEQYILRLSFLHCNIMAQANSDKWNESLIKLYLNLIFDRLRQIWGYIAGRWRNIFRLNVIVIVLDVLALLNFGRVLLNVCYGTSGEFF